MVAKRGETMDSALYKLISIVALERPSTMIKVMVNILILQEYTFAVNDMVSPHCFKALNSVYKDRQFGVHHFRKLVWCSWSDASKFIVLIDLCSKTARVRRCLRGQQGASEDGCSGANHIRSLARHR